MDSRQSKVAASNQQQSQEDHYCYTNARQLHVHHGGAVNVYTNYIHLYTDNSSIATLTYVIRSLITNRWSDAPLRYTPPSSLISHQVYIP